jgi:RHS repeat-associated protein
VDEIYAEEQLSGPGPGTVYWMLTDHLGSVRDVVQGAGASAAVVKHLAYTAFGQPSADSNPGLKVAYSFAGREFEAAFGMYYNRARYYDAFSGRFLAEDPLGLGPDSNPYRYVGNQPTSYTGNRSHLADQ